MIGSEADPLSSLIAFLILARPSRISGVNPDKPIHVHEKFRNHASRENIDVTEPRPIEVHLVCHNVDVLLAKLIDSTRLEMLDVAQIKAGDTYAPSGRDFSVNAGPVDTLFDFEELSPRNGRRIEEFVGNALSLINPCYPPSASRSAISATLTPSASARRRAVVSCT